MGLAVRARRIIVPVALGVALAGCGLSEVRAPVEQRGMPTAEREVPGTQPRPGHHRVRRGDTLYGLAWQYDLDYRQVAAWNGIRRPYTIYPGQRLRLSPPPARAVNPPPVTATPPPERRPQVAPTPSPPVPRSVPGAAAGLHWQWPAEGPVVRRFSPKSGSKGIDIAGRFGQEIAAAAGGRVVYSGSGLRGYGKLIIIKHNDSHLSAYAHNDRLLVKEGDTVRGGQRIASMGRAGDRQARLHFQVRRSGEPVDPLRYLPKR